MRFYPVTKVDFQTRESKAKNRVWMNIAKSLCVKIYFKLTWNHIHRVIFSMMRWIPIVFASHWVHQLLGFGLLSQFDSQEKRPKIIFCSVFYGKNLTLKPKKVWWEFSAYRLSYFLYCTFAFGGKVVGHIANQFLNENFEEHWIDFQSNLPSPIYKNISLIANL